MLPELTYQPTTSYTYSIYRDVLDYRELPIITPTADEKKKYNEARGKIFSDSQGSVYTDAYQRYQKAEKALALAQDAIKTFQNANLNTDVPNSYYVDLQQATRDYDLI